MTRKTIAVFDFDGTITRKDTLLEFIKFSKGSRQFFFGFLLFAPLFVAMKLRLYPNWKAKQKLFSYFYKGVSIKQFNEWGNGFSSKIDKIARPKATETIKSHKEKGDKIIIISASIENWIKPWAEKSGVDMVLATKIEADKNGLLTGKFLTKNCYGQEKVNRLLEVFPDRNEYKFTAYGDSQGDKELINFANEGFYNKFNRNAIHHSTNKHNSWRSCPIFFESWSKCGFCKLKKHFRNNQIGRNKLTSFERIILLRFEFAFVVLCIVENGIKQSVSIGKFGLYFYIVFRLFLFE